MMIMTNIISALIFVVISFITWLSVSFKVASYFIDEKKIFKKQANAIYFYLINILIAIFITVFCYMLVGVFQRLV